MSEEQAPPPRRTGGWIKGNSSVSETATLPGAVAPPLFPPQRKFRPDVWTAPQVKPNQVTWFQPHSPGETDPGTSPGHLLHLWAQTGWLSPGHSGSMMDRWNRWWMFWSTERSRSWFRGIEVEASPGYQVTHLDSLNRFWFKTTGVAAAYLDQQLLSSSRFPSPAQSPTDWRWTPLKRDHVTLVTSQQEGACHRWLTLTVRKWHHSASEVTEVAMLHGLICRDPLLPFELKFKSFVRVAFRVTQYKHWGVHWPAGILTAAPLLHCWA